MTDDETKKTEGWMESKGASTRYHYIVDGLSLCAQLGFYTAALQPAKRGEPRARLDCATCYRKLQHRGVVPWR